MQRLLVVPFVCVLAVCSASPEDPGTEPAREPSVSTASATPAPAEPAPPAAAEPAPTTTPATTPAAPPAAPGTRPKPVTPLMPRNLGMQAAGELFASRGVQTGQPLPELSLLDLDGNPVPSASLHDGKPLVLITCSLTCNVARNRQAAVADVQRKWGQRATVVLVYTIDAHPVVDDCPYTGSNWVTPGNDADGVMERQPTSLAQRLVLAKKYAKDWAGGARVLVDGMDDASWHALGEAPNLGLVVDTTGTVVERCGWFDGAKVDRALAHLLP